MDISKRLEEKKDKEKRRKKKAKNKLDNKIRAANLRPSCVSISKNERGNELLITPPFWKIVFSVTLMFSSMGFPLFVLSFIGLAILSVKLIVDMHFQATALLIPIYFVLATLFYLFVKLAYSSLRIIITKKGKFAIWTWRKNLEKPNYIGTAKNMDIEIRDRYYNFYKEDRWNIFLGWRYIFMVVNKNESNVPHIDLYDHMFNDKDANRIYEFFIRHKVKVVIK